MAAEEKRVMLDEKGPEDDQFAVDFRDGLAMGKEWISGKGNLPDLLHIIRDMRKGDLGGLEAGFLAAVDSAARAQREGSARTPDLARAKQLLVPPAAEPAAPLVDVDEFRRQMRARQAKARLDELARRNAELFAGQVGGFGGGYPRKPDADWDGR